jgi:sec-independent protein translocase protein TatB
MFDVSFTELMVIGVVALVVIGPERLPKVARSVGQMLGRLQRYVNSVKSDINREMQIEELRKLQATVAEQVRTLESKVTHEMRDVETSVAKSVEPITAAVQEAVPATAPALASASPEVVTAMVAAVPPAPTSSVVTDNAAASAKPHVTPHV